MARPCWESRLPALPALSGPRQCGAEARGRGKKEVCGAGKLLMRGRSPPPPLSGLGVSAPLVQLGREKEDGERGGGGHDVSLASGAALV